MQKIIKDNFGTYVLELYAKKKFQISCSKFSKQFFRKGYYYYAGSAQKNLVQRIQRHLCKEKKLHWHIDYLTTIPSVQIENIFIANGTPKEMECNFISSLLLNYGLEIIVNNFGNSDCKKCKSHLLYSNKKINHNHFISRYQSIVSLIPASSFTF